MLFLVGPRAKKPSALGATEHGATAWRTSLRTPPYQSGLRARVLSFLKRSGDEEPGSTPITAVLFVHRNINR